MTQFTKHKPTEIPPIGESEFRKCYQLSEDYYGIATKIDGVTSKVVARYDHSRERWLISGAGNKELLVYYKEIEMEGV